MIGVIIQARMGSTRLPGKILKNIGCKSLLEHIFFRLTYLRHEVQIVVATSDLPRDNIVVEFCNRYGIDCFRGSETNVLERYYFCAKRFCFNHIVRLTGDNPFPDIDELDRLINLHIDSNADYTYSFGSLPIGVGAEIFTFEALKKSYMEGREPQHIEHVDEYILENPDLFKIRQLTVSGEKNRPEIRLTVDTEEDYKKACFIVENSEEYVSIKEAIRLCLQYV